MIWTVSAGFAYMIAQLVGSIFGSLLIVSTDLSLSLSVHDLVTGSVQIWPAQ